MTYDNEIYDAAERLDQLYNRDFGGKPKGRYRLASKLLRGLLKRRRIYPDDVEMLRRALLERGYVLIDMDSFFVVMSANSFVNYRRVNEDSLFDNAANDGDSD